MKVDYERIFTALCIGLLCLIIYGACADTRDREIKQQSETLERAGILKCGIKQGIKMNQMEAVKVGVGKWVANEEGVAIFQWVTNNITH